MCQTVWELKCPNKPERNATGYNTSPSNYPQFVIHNHPVNQRHITNGDGKASLNKSRKNAVYQYHKHEVYFLLKGNDVTGTWEAERSRHTAAKILCGISWCRHHGLTQRNTCLTATDQTNIALCALPYAWGNSQFVTRYNMLHFVLQFRFPVPWPLRLIPD